MAANVALSDTFDDWRTRTNQVIEYTQTDGGTNAWTVNNSTTSTSPTTEQALLILFTCKIHLMFLVMSSPILM
jgi:hypothetical protein